MPLHLSPLWHLGSSRRAPPLNIGSLSVSHAGTTTPTLPLGQPGDPSQGLWRHSLPQSIPHYCIFLLLSQPSSDRFCNFCPWGYRSLDFRGNVTTNSPIFFLGPRVPRSVLKHTILQHRHPFFMSWSSSESHPPCFETLLSLPSLACSPPPSFPALTQPLLPSANPPAKPSVLLQPAMLSYSWFPFTLCSFFLESGPRPVCLVSLFLLCF